MNMPLKIMSRVYNVEVMSVYDISGALHFLTGTDVTLQHVLQLFQFLGLRSTAVDAGIGMEQGSIWEWDRGTYRL